MTTKPRRIAGVVWMCVALAWGSAFGGARTPEPGAKRVPPPHVGWTRLSTWVGMAVNDLTARLRTGEGDIDGYRIERVRFPDTALGAPVHPGEHAAQMMVSGFTIKLYVRGTWHEYRLGRDQLHGQHD